MCLEKVGKSISPVLLFQTKCIKDCNVKGYRQRSCLEKVGKSISPVLLSEK